MREPEVFIRRTTGPARVPVCPVDEPAPPPPSRGWQNLTAQIEGEFRSNGARVWRRDDLKNAKGDRRAND
jgi:hypothetical protein